MRPTHRGITLVMPEPEPAPAPVYRQPLPRDAVGISALYDEAYRPADGGDPRDHYPFPQLLEPDWVAKEVREPSICWIVAELGGAVVGSAAAVRNIGVEGDRVAEVFGIVVRQDAQGLGIGAALLAHLDAALGDDAAVVLCESRTGDIRGWKIARRCGFQPIGFEPFAHTTPVGSESMLPTARIRPFALSRRSAARPATTNARALADLVAGASAAPPLDGQPTLQVIIDDALIRVRRDDREGERLLHAWRDRPRRWAGVVNLRRFEGENLGRQRYDGRYYVAGTNGQDLGSIRVVWDHTDRRARVLDLQSESVEVGATLIESAVADLRAEASGGPLVIALDVRADAPLLQTRLDALGFLPTAYYPALLADGPSRVDAVQFTQFDARPLDRSLDLLGGLDWPSAALVVGRVVASGHRRERKHRVPLGDPDSPC